MHLEKKQNYKPKKFEFLFVLVLAVVIFNSVLGIFIGFGNLELNAQNNSGTTDVILNIAPASSSLSSSSVVSSSSVSSSSSSRRSGGGGGGSSTPKFEICADPTFRDDNKNGVFDAGEINLGIETKLFDSKGNLIQTINTSSKVCFEKVQSGEKYTVEQSLPTANSKSTTGGTLKTIEDLNKDTRLSFGYYAPTRICTPITFQDINGNQQQEPFEPLFGEIYTELRDADGKLIATLNNPNSECFEVDPDICTTERKCTILQPLCAKNSKECDNWRPSCPIEIGNLVTIPGQEFVVSQKFCYQPTILPRTGGQFAIFAGSAVLLILIPVGYILIKSYSDKKEK
jgi:hypothetical protein